MTARIYVQEPLAPYLLFARQSVVHNPRWRIAYTHSLHLIEQFHLTIETKDEIFHLNEGEMIIVPAGKWHKIEIHNDYPAVFKSVYFDFTYVPRPGFTTRRRYFHLEGDSYVEDYVSPPIPYDLQMTVDVRHLAHWQALISPFIDFDIHEQSDSGELLKSQAFFLLFLRQYLQLASKITDIADPRIQKVIHSIENELVEADEHTLNDWIIQAGISHRHFYNLFKKQTGTTPVKYWNQLRMQKAKQDLKQTAMSVSDIAAKYHYPSIHYFSKHFHRLNGVSPTEYRKGLKL